MCVISQIRFITGLNPEFIRTGFFVAKDVGILYLNIMTILMVGQESQTDKLSRKLYCKTNEISRSLEFDAIELNYGLTNNYGLQK